MDANQTRFHLLLGHANWSGCLDPNRAPIFRAGSPLEWNDALQEVRLRSEPYAFHSPPLDRLPSQDDRRGTGADKYLNWYWISADREEIHCQSRGESTAVHFWSAADSAWPQRSPAAVFQPVEREAAPVPRTYSGLAVTEDHFLVVGTLNPGGLLVFDLLGGGSPQTIGWPVAFAPFDLVPRPGGGVWILDRDHKRFWGLERKLRVIAAQQTEVTLRPASDDLFQPMEGAPRQRRAVTFPAGVNLPQAIPVAAIAPVAIEALPDGSVLILDAPAGQNSRVLRYRLAEFLGEHALDFPAFDFALADGLLQIVSAEGNQSRAFTLGPLDGPLQLTPTTDFFPMRRFGGKALVAAGDRVYYDFGERWLPLVNQARPRYVTTALLQTCPPRTAADDWGFDGREPQCVWHRLMIDATLPPGAEIEVWSRAADKLAQLPLLDWDREPPLLQRRNGSELPFARSSPARNRETFELLFQKARGRYLQLQLRLSGNGRVTPRLHALRTYFPRFSYLTHYLPAVYRADAASAFFLDRFLANIEGTNTAIEDRIAAVQMLFDPRSAPGPALPWLATWFGVVLDPSWDESRRRLFLEHAIVFFQWRGTVRGLQMALRLMFDESPGREIFEPATGCGDASARGGYRIVERFLARQMPAVQFGDPSELANGLIHVPAGGPWKPEHGVEALQIRYRTFTGNPSAHFDFVPLADAEAENLRTIFAQRELHFVPSDPTDEMAAWSDYASSQGLPTAPAWPVDEPTDPRLARVWKGYQVYSDAEPFGRQRRLWQQFLVRRYVSVTALNHAHTTHWANFEQVSYPRGLSTNRSRLQDWFEFEANVLTTVATAHRFTVMLPMTRSTATTDEDRRQQLALASRIIELEKPAHTTFDVKFFWALFRIGEARLGTDSILGQGGRDPGLYTATVLGRHYLGEGFVGTGFPPSLRGRLILGRDTRIKPTVDES